MSEAIRVVSLHDLGDDVLLVRGMRGDQPLEARGWISATRNYYETDEWPIGEDGHRHPDARARQMRPAEIVEYARGLLEAQNPEPKDAAELPTLGDAGSPAEPKQAKTTRGRRASSA